MNNFFKQTLIIIVLILLLILPYFVFAGNPATTLLEQVGPDAGYQATSSTNNIMTMVGTVIKAFLSLLGAIFIVLIIYGGYTWMMAGGDEQKVTKAKDTIWRAVIGLMIVVAASAATSFVFNYI